MGVVTRASRYQEGIVSNTNQFWEYAEEAMLSALRAKTDKEKRTLIDLAHTWTQAALQSESMVVVNFSPPEHRSP